MIDKLGAKHAAFGISEKEQYMHFVDSLLYALEKHLGDKWNDELESIWKETYLNVMEIMIAAGEKYSPDEKKKKPGCIIS